MLNGKILLLSFLVAACSNEARVGSETGYDSTKVNDVANTDSTKSGEVYYVTADSVEVREFPKSGLVVDRVPLYRGKLVRVYDIEDGWALVTGHGYRKSWIAMNSLGKAKPEQDKRAIGIK